MFRGNYWAVVFCLFLFSLQVLAEEDLSSVEGSNLSDVTTERMTGKKTRVIKVKRQKSKVWKTWALGGGYTLWNEDLKLEQSGIVGKGFANYGGFNLNIEYNRLGRRWVHAYGGSFGFGKASSGGFDSTPAFADGVNRSWWSVQAGASMYYRLNSVYMVGAGIIWRERTVDWTPADSTIIVTPDSKKKLASQILLRWRINDDVTFIQAYTLLSLKGSNMWTWTLQMSL